MPTQASKPTHELVLCSFHSEGGLEFVRVNAPPSTVWIKMRNISGKSFRMMNLPPTPAIRIDFSRAGGAIPSPLTDATLSGFETVSFTGSVLTLQLAYNSIWWLEEDVWTIELPGFVLNGGAGVGSIGITLLNAIPDASASEWNVTIPLIRLNPSSAGSGGAARLLAAWDGSNRITRSPYNGQTRNSLRLKLQARAGTAAAGSEGDGGAPEAGGIYCSLLSGNWQGLPALDRNCLLNAASLATGTPDWTATRVASTGMPLWSLSHGAGAAAIAGGAPLNLTFEDLISHLPGGAGYAAVYAFGIPGYTDHAMALAVSVGNGAVQITSFNASPLSFNNINGPVAVSLNWQVANASAVTLTGYGTVDPLAGTLSPLIESTTTFVLTAFDAALANVVSKAVTVTVTPELVTRLVPAGTIMAWNGAQNAIPVNWFLCDGSNNTPNLADKFLMGAGGSASPNQSGDADTHTHPIPAQGQMSFETTQVSDHTHQMPSTWHGRNLDDGGFTSIDTNGTYTSSTPSGHGGGHGHSVTVTIPGFDSQPNSNGVRPPWYALCYIMKGF